MGWMDGWSAGVLELELEWNERSGVELSGMI